jgi:uracil-DNA glycosylase family 4
VFIGNVVKCRPQTTAIHTEELTACSEYLERQIQAIAPLIHWAYSMARFLPTAKIGDVQGYPSSKAA